LSPSRRASNAHLLNAHNVESYASTSPSVANTPVPQPMSSTRRARNCSAMRRYAS
jgi:hypothetical protein